MAHVASHDQAQAQNGRDFVQQILNHPHMEGPDPNPLEGSEVKPIPHIEPVGSPNGNSQV